MWLFFLYVKYKYVYLSAETSEMHGIMKTRLRAFIILLVLLAFCGSETYAQSFYEWCGSKLIEYYIKKEKNGKKMKETDEVVVTNSSVRSSSNNISSDSYSGFIKIPETIKHKGKTYRVTRIGRDAFKNCVNLKEVVIPNSVTYIGSSAFSGCTGLTKITIPNSVTVIENYTFYECTGLTNITIPNSVTSIGNSAFYGCSSLTSMYIPSAVTKIGTHPFLGCRGLTRIVVESGNSVYDSRENCNAIIETATNTIIAGCQTTIVPTSVTAIGKYAFIGMNLKSIKIPKSVTHIGNAAFKGCKNLSEVNMEAPVANIEKDAFEGSPWWDANNDNTENIVYVGTVAHKAVSEDITSCRIKEGTTAIDESCFKGCSRLTGVVIPNTVTSIGKNAFSSCSSLERISIPSSVTSIGNSAFEYCKGLKEIIIPGSVKILDNYVFLGCTGLTSVTLSNGLTTIGNRAFNECNALAAITLPNGLKTIGSNAFSNCKNLQRVDIPETVARIGDNSFYMCYNLTAVNVNENNKWYKSIDGVLFTKNADTLLVYPPAKASIYYNIPSSVTHINSFAFHGSKALKQVVIPNSVSSLGNSIFGSCDNLTELVVPDHPIKLDKYSLSDLYYLQNISTNRGTNPSYIYAYLPEKCPAQQNNPNRPASASTNTGTTRQNYQPVVIINAPTYNTHSNRNSSQRTPVTQTARTTSRQTTTTTSSASQTTARSTSRSSSTTSTNSKRTYNKYEWDFGSFEKCKRCNGTGRVECSSCKGVGFFSGIAATSAGKKTTRTNCNRCAATGKLSCNACRGTGRVQ